jgi:hypothetical protein
MRPKYSARRSAAARFADPRPTDANSSALWPTGAGPTAPQLADGNPGRGPFDSRNVRYFQRFSERQTEQDNYE